MEIFIVPVVVFLIILMTFCLSNRAKSIFYFFKQMDSSFTR